MEVISKGKERIASGQDIFLWEGTNRIFVMWITSPVLIGNFRWTVSQIVAFLGKVETVIHSWFAVLGSDDSSFGFLSLFLTLRGEKNKAVIHTIG